MTFSHRTPRTLILLCLGFFFINGFITDAQAQQIQVNAADPPVAEQGTLSLDVKVTGKGFKNGAQAKWFVTGTTNPGGVTVNSTTFVSSTELRATITVVDTAEIANFDIQVLNSDGRGGKGTELFRVTAKGGGNSSCPPMQPAPMSDTKCYGALPGCLDSSFGGVGYVDMHIGSGNFGQGTNAVIVQPDGKIVAATGVQNSSGDSDFAVIRFNSDGSLDSSFGDPDPFNPTLRRGFALTPFTNENDDGMDLLQQPDGKIVVFGQAGTTGSGSMAVARYNVDGTLDTSFGSAGKVMVSFGGRVSARGNSIVRQSDGKLVLGGAASVQNTLLFGMARLNTNGTLDSSFGSGGKLIVNPSGVKNASATVRGITIQRIPAVTGEERIVVAGASTPGSDSGYRSWFLMRFKPNGGVDTTFGTNAVVKTNFFGFHDDVKQIEVDSNNRIVAIGSTYTASPNFCGTYTVDAAVVRYLQDGVLDTTFSGGKQILDVYGGTDSASALALQPDGKILVTGHSASSDLTIRHFALIRLNADGTRDSSFGLLGNGVVTVDFGGSSVFGLAIAIQPNDGRIVVGGSTSLVPGEPAHLLVARYLH
jgi:uncharacterized delta-60 repeat protein